MNDLESRELALDIGQSFIVQAPAGSGKTQLLTERYLKLLTVCENPETVVAMTFTNKATDELRQRVLEALRSVDNPRPNAAHERLIYDLASMVVARDKLKNWRILELPERLKILTFDALSGLIARRFALQFSTQNPRILSSSWEAQQFYRRAAEQVLKLIDDPEHQADIADLLLYLDNNIERFFSLLTLMLAKREQWLSRLFKQDVFDPKILKNSATIIIKNHLAALKDEAKNHLDERFFALTADNSIEQYASIKSLPDDEVADLPQWILLADLLLKKDGGWRKTVNKNQGFDASLKAEKTKFVEFLQVLAEANLDDFRTLLAQTKNLPDVEMQDFEIEILHNIAAVLKLCVAELNIIFEHEQVCDFPQISLIANRALSDNDREVALYFDYKIQHLLIDEFQDTSVSQFGLVEKIINNWQPDDGKTLFVVGDPMQSIYRFRESQVSLFLQVRQYGIKDLKPKSLVLSKNFRSSSSIISTNNNIFADVFPAKNDIHQGAITYSSAEFGGNCSSKNTPEFHPFLDDDGQAEALKIAEIITDTTSKNPDFEVAVLVRGRAHLLKIAAVLTEQKIDFEQLKITPFAEHLLTRDLFSLTRALLHLGDKSAWLAVLRAPWCGLELRDLLIFADDDTQIIYQKLADKDILNCLSDDGKKRAQHLHFALADAVNNQARFSMVELLIFAIQQLNIAPAFSDNERIIYEQFLQIIHNCEVAQSLDIETISLMLQDLYAPSKTAKVKLMTIHSAKGLEFDCVIIPQLHKATAVDKKPIIHINEFVEKQAMSLLLSPIKSAAMTNDSNTFSYLQFINKQQSYFESMRLLYVAMTRARHNLHLLGTLKTDKNAHSNSFLSLLMPVYYQAFDGLEPVEVAPIEPKIAPKLKRIKHLKPVQKSSKIIEKSSEHSQNFELLFKSILGTMTHKFLEDCDLSPSPAKVITTITSAGFPPAKIDEAAKFILKLLKNTQDDPIFTWLFKPRKSTLVEAEFIDESGQTIIIDRLFIDQDTLWIIDFKTATPTKNEPTSTFITRQKSTHTPQLKTYQKTLSSIYQTPIKSAIYLPSIQQLVEI